MEKKYNVKKKAIFGHINRERIEGLEGSVFLEKFPPIEKGNLGGPFRIIICDGENELSSSVLNGWYPTEPGRSIIIDNGKQLVFVANDNIVSCIIDGKESSIEEIKLSCDEKRQRIIQLDYIKERDAFVAQFIGDQTSGYIGYSKDFDQFFVYDKYDNNLGGYDRELKYDETSGMCRYNILYRHSFAQFRIEGELDLLTGDRNAHLTSVGNITFSEEELEKVSIKDNENNGVELEEKFCDIAFQITKERIEKELSKSSNPDIQYEVLEGEYHTPKIIAHIGAVSIEYNTNIGGNLFPTSIIPDYNGNVPCIKMPVDKNKPPIPISSIYGECATDKDKKISELNRRHYGKIERDKIKLHIETVLDKEGNVIDELKVFIQANPVSSEHGEFDAEELTGVVSKHYEVLNSLLNVPLLSNPYGEEKEPPKLMDKRP